MNPTHSADTEADALNAPSLTPAQVTAQKLAERWEERLRESELESPSLSRCLRELQAAFGLDFLGAQAGEPEHKP